MMFDRRSFSSVPSFRLMNFFLVLVLMLPMWMMKILFLDLLWVMMICGQKLFLRLQSCMWVPLSSRSNVYYMHVLNSAAWKSGAASFHVLHIHHGDIFELHNLHNSYAWCSFVVVGRWCKIFWLIFPWFGWFSWDIHIIPLWWNELPITVQLKTIYLWVFTIQGRN